MTETSVTLRPASADERDRIVDLLEGNDLPAADLQTSPVRLFIGVHDGELVGVGGFEKHGTDGLLRSVVVPAEKRNRGYGSALCDRLAERAAVAGIETLYLLTTTARGFFGEQGYDPVARENVPDAIRRTTQFEGLCPDSATCLRRSLD
jgi:amino-acid N-acetyltransferase